MKSWIANFVCSDLIPLFPLFYSKKYYTLQNAYVIKLYLRKNRKSAYKAKSSQFKRVDDGLDTVRITLEPEL